MEALKRMVPVALVSLILSLLLWGCSFVSLSENTVLQTLPSPSGTCEARVIENDQGAMGGATIVEVERDGAVWRIYTGPWSEAETIEVYWKDDTCLVINGKEYAVE